MKTDPALWQRLANLEFDEPDAEFPFTQRLARDNNWTFAYARKVLEEYKRFAYLTTISDDQLTPSDQVDQAWHLHLSYTRHYWGPFTEAINCTLHHNPTKGGRDQFRTFFDNYDKTKKLYQTEFGLTPPLSVWPTATKRFDPKIDQRRVNTKNKLLIPTHWFFGTIAVLVFILLGAIFASPAIKLQGDETTSCNSLISCMTTTLGIVNAEYAGTSFLVGFVAFITLLLANGFGRFSSGSSNGDNGLTFAIKYRHGGGGNSGGCSGGGCSGGGCSGCGGD